MNQHELIQHRRYESFDLRTRVFVHIQLFRYRWAMRSKAGMPGRNFIGWMNSAQVTHGPAAAIWVIDELVTQDEMMVGSSRGYFLFRNPSSLGRRLLRRLPFSQRVLERVFGQVVADMRQEAHDAITANDVRAYRLALLRGRLALLWSAIRILWSARG